MKRVYSIGVIILPILAGCERGTSAPENRTQIPALEISLVLPAGWQAASDNPAMFFDPQRREENWGSAAEYARKGKNLDEFIDGLLGSARKLEAVCRFVARLTQKTTGRSPAGSIAPTRIVSRTSKTINGQPAVIVVTEAEYSLCQLFVQRDNRVIQILFRAPKDAFAALEPEFLKSLDSVRIDGGSPCEKPSP